MPGANIDDKSIDQSQLKKLAEQSIQNDDEGMSSLLLLNNFELAAEFLLENKISKSRLLVMLRFMPMQKVDHLIESFLKLKLSAEKIALLTESYHEVKKEFLAKAPFYSRHAKIYQLKSIMGRYNRPNKVNLAEIAQRDMQYGAEREILAKKLYAQLLEEKNGAPTHPAFLDLSTSTTGSRNLAVLVEKISSWLYDERTQSMAENSDLFKSLRSQHLAYGKNDDATKEGRQKLYRGFSTPFHAGGYEWAKPLIDAVHSFSEANDVLKGAEGYHLLYSSKIITSIIEESAKWSHGILPINDTWKHLENLFETIWSMDLNKTNRDPYLKGKNSYEKNLTQFYARAAELAWLLGNTQPLMRGTGTVVELLFAIIHLRHHLKPPILQIEFPQIDVLDITFPLSDYIVLFPGFFEPSTIPKHLLTEQYNLTSLTAAEQLKHLYIERKKTIDFEDINPFDLSEYQCDLASQFNLNFLELKFPCNFKKLTAYLEKIAADAVFENKTNLLKILIKTGIDSSGFGALHPKSDINALNAEDKQLVDARFQAPKLPPNLSFIGNVQLNQLKLQIEVEVKANSSYSPKQLGKF